MSNGGYYQDLIEEQSMKAFGIKNKPAYYAMLDDFIARFGALLYADPNKQTQISDGTAKTMIIDGNLSESN